MKEGSDLQHKRYRRHTLASLNFADPAMAVVVQRRRQLAHGHAVLVTEGAHFFSKPAHGRFPCRLTPIMWCGKVFIEDERSSLMAPHAGISSARGNALAVKRQCRAIVPHGSAAALPPQRGPPPQEAPLG